MKKRKIAVVTTTRAEFGILKPLLEKIHSSDSLELLLIVSGTHLENAFGKTIDEIQASGLPIFLRIPYISKGTSKNDTALSAGQAALNFAQELKGKDIDMLVLLGDRYETLSIAHVVNLLGIPIAHIHGGEKTVGSLDDSIRHAISKISHLHFVSCEAFRKRILQLGEESERIYVTGAVGVDGIQNTPLMSFEELKESCGFIFSQPFFLCTVHSESTDPGGDKKRVGELLRALDEVDDFALLFTGSNADTNGLWIDDRLESFAAERDEKRFFVKSLGQQRFYSALKHSTAFITNSSAGIIEAPALQTVTLNLGQRQRGRPQAPSIYNSSFEKSSILNKIKEIAGNNSESGDWSFDSPYGTGGATEKILMVLENIDLRSIREKIFQDLN